MWPVECPFCHRMIPEGDAVEQYPTLDGRTMYHATRDGHEIFERGDLAVVSFCPEDADTDFRSVLGSRRGEQAKHQQREPLSPTEQEIMLIQAEDRS